MTGLRTRLSGVAAAPGIARGPWATPSRSPIPASRQVPVDEVAGEITRLRDAAKAASADLRALAARIREAGHPDEAAIFLAHAAMARDPDVIDPAAAEIENRHVDAIGAILASSAAAAARIGALDDERLRGRAADVRDVGDRIARRLAGLDADEPLLAEPAIVVGDDLSPSLTATLPRDRILGIALEGSSATAHAAILARAYGIPAVVGVRGLLEALRASRPDAQLAIDGATGEVLIDPDTADQVRFAGLADAARSRGERDLAEASLASTTRDGTAVELLANIGTPAEAASAVALGARGVGLFRTEFLFLERSEPPGEDEQVAAYRAVVDAFGGLPVTIRLLDVGGDKPIPYLKLPREDNPFLGVRALRLAGQRSDLFLTQLRASYRAAVGGPVKVMAPMIADATDAATLRTLAVEARGSLEREGVAAGEVALGVMLEIPSAILTADAYFDDLAFASLGTNDLAQYTLAVDRGNPALERYRDSLHPAVLRLIRMSVEAADRAGIELSVCGEMAGDPASALALVGLGVRHLSMSAASLAAVRRAIRAADLGILVSTAESSLDEPSAREVRARFRALLD